MSSRSSCSNGSTSIPSARAATSVAIEVATQRIVSPRAASAGSIGATVVPVPRPDPVAVAHQLRRRLGRRALLGVAVSHRR